MRDVITIAVPALVLGLLYCLYRAALLFAAWRPAAALVWSNDYSELEILDDRWGMGSLRGWHLTDGDHSRLIDECVHYEDGDGGRHIAQVSRYVRRGFSPDGVHMIWYEIANPDRATAFGPGSWLLGALAAAAMLGELVYLALRLRG